MATISSIRTSGDKIEIVDQLLLPHTQEWIEIDTTEKAYEAIKSMKASRKSPPFRGQFTYFFVRSEGHQPSAPWQPYQLRRTSLFPLPKIHDRISCLHRLYLVITSNPSSIISSVLDPQRLTSVLLSIK